MSGYNKRPLHAKLGLKPGFRVFMKNSPENYQQLIHPLNTEIQQLKRIGKQLDMIHLFTQSRTELQRLLPKYLDSIKSDGMIWVSWPKYRPSSLLT